MDQSKTITISLSPIAKERLKFIQDAFGMNSRSATVVIAINELYERLLEAEQSK